MHACVYFPQGYGVRILISASSSSVSHFYYLYFPPSHILAALPRSGGSLPGLPPRHLVLPFITLFAPLLLHPYYFSLFSHIHRTRYNLTRSCTYLCRSHCFPPITPPMSSSSTVYGCRYPQCILHHHLPWFLEVLWSVRGSSAPLTRALLNELFYERSLAHRRIAQRGP